MARRPRKDPEELRLQILEAARRIIATDGPESLTARRLASEIGYTPGTIYNQFENLSQVLWEVNRDNFARIGALFANLPEGSPSDRLEALATGYLTLVTANPALFQGLFGGPRRSPEFPQWYLDAISGLLDQIAVEVSAIAPALPPQAARREAEQLFIAIHGVAALSVDGRLDMISTADPAALGCHMVRRMLNDLAAEHG
ncbi:MAG: TetR/AcrR family transcriptional regulator [Paracoccus sp. (in: a-proteobacteria)]|nr:TetR/AcrR family transcriptional regulator [Paracoccus sp. (in: a-proteobacteria)]